jgi:chlorobactene glucosyltransferase
MFLLIWLLLGVVITFLFAFLSIHNYKFIKTRGLGQFPSSTSSKKVSILIPAKNEENNIRGCVESLLAQSYPNYEVIVLDDQSSDQTGPILEELAKNHPQKFKFIKGKPLEEGWMGKCFACHNLSKEAKGDYLVFIDADVKATHPEMLTKLIGEVEHKKADFATVHPTEVLGTYGEVPIIFSLTLFVFGIIPANLYENPKYPSISFANGQCLFFSRNLYDQIGGHCMVKNRITEDIEFAKILKANYIPFLFTFGEKYMECRMYEGFWQTFKGFQKNLIAVMRSDKLALVTPLIFILLDSLPIALLIHLFWFPVTYDWLMGLVAVSVLLHFWISCFLTQAYLKTSSPFLTPFSLHIGCFVAVLLVIPSFIASIRGKLEWKGRVYKMGDMGIKKIEFKRHQSDK